MTDYDAIIIGPGAGGGITLKSASRKFMSLYR